MPRISIRGELHTQLSGLFGDLSKRLFVFGDTVISDSTTVGGLSTSSSLFGRSLTMPDAGPDAMQGRITRMERIELDFRGSGSVLEGDVTPLTITGLSLNAVSLFDLIDRPATGRATFDLVESVLIRALNGTGSVITGSRSADQVAPDSCLRLSHDDRIDGRGGDDYLAGGRGNDALAGGEGNDILFGGTGRDRMFGGAGNDRLDGGPQADRITGGAGDDRMKGGWGADVFGYGSGDDVVVDFRDGVDRIRLEAPHAVTDAGADTLITFGANSILLVGIDAALVGTSDFL